MPSPDLGALVLTGGTAVRLGGVDKAGIELAGSTLLERALTTLAGIDDVVVVGDEVATSRPVTFRREEPPFGGPAAALLAGLTGFPALPRLVVVLAVDMACVTPDTVGRLVAAAGDGDGALLVDAGGRRQFACAVYETSALLRARPEPGDEHGLPLRRLVTGLRLTEVPAYADEARDLDTWTDLAELREVLARDVPPREH